MGLCILAMTWGHDLVYRLMMPGSMDHHPHHDAEASVAALHAYMPLLSRSAVALALAGGFAWMVMSALSVAPLSQRAQRAARYMQHAPVIALPLLFVVTEIVERLPAHAGLPPLPLLLVGIVIQVLCGIAAGRIVAAVLDGAARVARGIARFFRRSPRRTRVGGSSGIRLYCDQAHVSRGVPNVCMDRGPPLLVMS